MDIGVKKGGGKYRKIVENIPEVIYYSEIGNKPRMIFLSKRMEELTGYPVENFLSDWHFWSKLIHPEDRETVDKEIKKSIKNKSKFECEYRFRKKDGNYLNVIDIAKPIKSKKGDVQSFQGLLIDITEHKKIEEALRESEEELNSIFDAAVDGIAYVDTSGKVIRVNSRLMEMLGYKKNETVGKNITALGDIESKDIPKVLKAFGEVRLTGKPIRDFDVTLIRKGGYRISTKISTDVVKKAGKIIGIIVVVKDVTESKKVEEALRESEEKYRNLFENANDGIIYIDKWGKIIDVNQKALQIFGGSRKELLGKQFTKIGLFSLMDIAKLTSNFVDIIKGKTVTTTVNFKNKNGRMIFLECSSSIIKKDKKIINIMVIARDISERKVSEEVLKESEEKYKAIFEGSTDGILVADIKTKKFMFANPEICKITGYSLKELLKLSVNDIHPKKDLPYVIDQFTKQIRGEIILARDIPVLRKNKKIIYCDVNSRSIEFGGKRYLAGFFRDITENKKAENALKKNENKYRTLIENLPQKIFLKDKNSVYISCNENYAKDLKIKPEEIVGRTDFEFYPRKLAEKYRADDKKFLKSYKAEDIEEKYILNGKEFWVHTIKTPVKDEKGNVIGILGIFWDITEQKKLLEKIKNSNDRYQFYIDVTGQLDWTTDAKGMVTEDILSWRTFTGQSFKEVKGWGWIKAIHPDDIIRTTKIWKKTVETKSVYDIEYRLRRHDGVYRWFLAKGVPLFRKDGSIREWVGTCIDITERKKAEEEIKSAQERWNSLTKNTNDIIIIVDSKCIIRYINKTIPPYTPEGTVGKTIYEYTPREQHDKMRESFRKVFKTGNQDNYETCSKIPNIGIMWFSTKLVPIKHDENITGVIMINTDITKSKAAGEEIKKAKDELQSKLEDLEKFNKLSVGRELKMVELKKKIKELEGKLQKK